MAKYAPNTAPLLLKLKKTFVNSKLGSIEKHPDKQITEPESLRNNIDKMCLSTSMTDQDVMIHILNNLTEEHVVVLD